jgi:effector-binding domain-containing protein
MWNEPTIVQREAQPYVAIKALVTMQELATAIPPLNGEVFGWLAAHGGTPAGPPFWKYNVIDMERQLEVEAGVGVQQPVPGDDRVLSATLPAGRYATLVHTGPPNELVDATAALLDWARRRDLTWDRSDATGGQRWGARLEFYLTDPDEEPDLSQWETELAFRLADGSLRMDG